MYEAQREHKMSRHFDNAFSPESQQIKTLTTTKRSLLPQQLSLSENMRRPTMALRREVATRKTLASIEKRARAAKASKDGKLSVRNKDPIG